MAARIGRAVAASLTANMWGTLISLLFVPIYIRLIGIESYGLIGIFYALQSLLSILDFGLTTTVTREMAAISEAPAKRADARTLVRTLETVYWGVAILILCGTYLLSPVIALHWIGSNHLGTVALVRCTRLIAIAIGVQWPASFYSGGLIGLNRQVLVAGVSGTLTTVRAVGAVAVLLGVARSAPAFFAWQAVMSGIYTVTFAALLWASLPRSVGLTGFKLTRLREVGRFSAGVSAVSVIGLALTQADKVVLSRMLSLQSFGYYSLAIAVSSSLMRLVRPVYDATFPRLTALADLGDQGNLADFYHRSSSLLSVAVLPATLVLAVMAPEVLWAWTGTRAAVANSGALVPALSVGTAIYGLLNMPWALRLAHRWTALDVRVNLVAVACYVPIIVVLTHFFGALGAAVAWLVLNVVYMFVIQQLMHRKLLRGELWRWYFDDIGRPLLAAGAAILICRLVVPQDLSRVAAGVVVVASTVIGYAAAVISVPYLRARTFGSATRLL